MFVRAFLCVCGGGGGGVMKIFQITDQLLVLEQTDFLSVERTREVISSRKTSHEHI